jgi:hypothetical protein
MHPAIEHQSMPTHLKIIRIRTNLGAARQVNEFQIQISFSKSLILLSAAQLSEQPLS